MRKSSRSGYWFQRDRNSRSQDYGTAGTQRTNNSESQNQQLNLARQNQTSINILSKKSASLQSNVQKLTKMQDFYQIMCSGQFAEIGVRCYEHNNELILYCMNDHKLLCPNCMYAGNANQHKIQQSDKNMKSDKKKKAKPLNNPNLGIHSNHDVRQIVKCSAQVSNDVKIGQFQAKQKISLVNSCRLGWQKMKQTFEKTKQSILNQLDKQYDNLQQQLSTRYLQIKKQLNAVSQSYSLNLQKIIASYRIISKLIMPSRYPILTVKHSWLERMKNNILPQVQMVQPVVVWLRSYEGHSRIILKKIHKKMDL